MDEPEFASPVAHRNIYTGIWVNWSRGPIMGSTLTLTRDRGNLLIAFTAFFVAFISTRLWRVLCFAFHRYYSTPQARDGLYHQRQALLRNSSSPDWGLWSLGQLGWAWRHVAETRSLLRILPAAFAAALCTVGFAVAGGFSSQISTGISDEVLVDGKNCGWFVSAVSAKTQVSSTVMMAEEARRVNNAANYAQQCYSSKKPGSSCNSYAVPRLSMSVDTEAPCPFKNGICRSNSSNIVIDSGLIDTHDHLGLNAPKEQRLRFRHIMQCAPLRTQNYSSVIRGSFSNYTLYHYGQKNTNGADFYGHLAANTTLLVPSQYAAKNSDMDLLKKILPSRGSPLTNVIESVVLNRSTIMASPWTPIDDLRRPDGDTHIVFLVANGAVYLAPTTDGWYKATTPFGETGSVSLNGNISLPTVNLTGYRHDEPASPMACLQQYQYCDPSLPLDTGCGPVGSFLDAIMGAGHLFNLTAEETLQMPLLEPPPVTGPTSRFTWIPATMFFLARNSLGIVQSLGPGALESQQTVRTGFQSKQLPRDQWKREVRHWYSIWLALLQSSLVDGAIGLTNSSAFQLDASVRRPRNQFDREVCDNQKIRSQEHTSFSMFGVCFTLVTGLLITIASYVLEPIFDCLHRRKGSPEHDKYAEWNSNETLHLQCLGYHGRGEGVWTRFGHTVPITEEKEALLPLVFGKSSYYNDMQYGSPTDLLEMKCSNQSSNSTSAVGSSVTLSPDRSTQSFDQSLPARPSINISPVMMMPTPLDNNGYYQHAQYPQQQYQQHPNPQQPVYLSPMIVQQVPQNHYHQTHAAPPEAAHRVFRPPREHHISVETETPINSPPEGHFPEMPSRQFHVVEAYDGARGPQEVRSSWERYAACRQTGQDFRCLQGPRG